MKIKYLFFIVLALLCLTGCGKKLSPENISPTTKNNLVTIPPGQFYFFSRTCPHCATVNQYVADHNIKNRLYYVEREVGSDENNINLLKSIASQCKITENDLSVPFFWDGEHCYQGADDVIAYFEKIQTK